MLPMTFIASSRNITSRNSINGFYSTVLSSVSTKKELSYMSTLISNRRMFIRPILKKMLGRDISKLNNFRSKKVCYI